MLQLVDTRRPEEPPDEPDRPPWEPNWPLWGWVAATVVAAVLADALGGFAGYVLVLLAVVCCCRAVGAVLPSMDGLREYRQ
jgi:hypothetical protein